MNETLLRERLVQIGRRLYERGLSPGTSGNLSARLQDGWLVTPTNACLGELHADRLSRLDDHGRHTSGPAPTKEVPLHLAYYHHRAGTRAVVHLHSPAAVAVSCLTPADPGNVLRPLTPYFVMRVGQLPLVPYLRPGHPDLASHIARLAVTHPAVLLANHGPVVSGVSLDAATAIAEELEEAARLSLGLHGLPARYLTDDEIRELRHMADESSST